MLPISYSVDRAICMASGTRFVNDSVPVGGGEGGGVTQRGGGG